MKKHLTAKKLLTSVLTIALLLSMSAFALPAFAATDRSTADWSAPDSCSSNAGEDDFESIETNAEYVAGLDFLTAEEQAVLLQAYDQIDELLTEAETLYDADGELLSQAAAAREDAICAELDVIFDRISAIDEKICAQFDFDCEADSEGLTETDDPADLACLTETEKTTLLAAYAELDELFTELDALYDADGCLQPADQPAADKLWAEIEQIGERIAPIETKVMEAGLL